MGRPPQRHGCGRGNTGLWRRQTREPGDRRRRLRRAACGDGVSVLVFSLLFCFLKKSRILEQGRIKDSILRSLPGFIRCSVIGTGRAGQGGHVASPGPGRGRLPLPRGAPEARRPPRRHPIPENQQETPGLLLWEEAGPHWQTGKEA